MKYKTPKELKAFIIQVNGLISRKHPDIEGALNMLKPFLTADTIYGFTEAQSCAGLHLLCSLAGDCFRINGNIEKAIHQYGRALKFTPGGACSEYYAELVVDHKLSKHYQNAYDNLIQNKENHKKMPLSIRIKASICLVKSIIKRPGLYKERRESNKRSKTLKDELQVLLQES
jgi:tetratricopeptide (TPR) repeat protein